jgi:hypothetical protein
MRLRTGVLLTASAFAITIATATSAVADDSKNQQYCTTTANSTRCLKAGDAEINSSIPAPPAGPWAMYGPFWGGN